MFASSRRRRCPVSYDYALHDSGDPAPSPPWAPQLLLGRTSAFPKLPCMARPTATPRLTPKPPYAGRQEPLGDPRTRDEGFGLLVIAHEKVTRFHRRFEVCLPHRAYPTTRPPSVGENKNKIYYAYLTNNKPTLAISLQPRNFPTALRLVVVVQLLVFSGACPARWAHLHASPAGTATSTPQSTHLLFCYYS